jgi:uncharacterized protein YciI
MFIIEITYKVPTEQIDANMAAHMKYVDKYYHSGNFLASGRKEPRDGGIIFAKAESLAEVNAIVAEDPFCVLQLADYRVIHFKATKKVKAFDALDAEDNDL